jgi:polysaccharide chain length determinant protein (PEP-CTERM system associated)
MKASRSEGLNIGYWVALASRRRWLIIVPFCLAVIVGSILSVKLPRIYEASTLILVQPQRVPEKLVQPVVDIDSEHRISTISQQIMSRSNLEKVIEKFRLFSGIEPNAMFMEDKVNDLRQRIKVEVSRTRSRNDTDAFTISFRDRDPQVTMQVANGLATFFIDENLKSREGQAVGTTDFLEAELETMRKRLEEEEERLKQYRQANMGELPEQLASNLEILGRLHMQLGQKEESLRSARVSLAALETESVMRQNALIAASSGRSGRGSEETMSVAELQERLNTLRAGYTDQHPDVVRLRAKIEKLQAEEAANPKPAGPSEPKTATEAITAAGPGAVRQKILIEGDIQGLLGDIARLNQEIRYYQRRVEAAPKREQEMISLRRNYDNIRDSYSSLLNRKLEADISVNMEKKQKGEQFHIIDPARLPVRPVSPDPRRLFLITILAGLGLGCGLVFLSDMMDTSVRRLDEFEEKFGMVVLANVPRIFTRRDKIRHRFRQVATAVSIFIALALTAGFAAICFLGVDPAIGIVMQ